MLELFLPALFAAAAAGIWDLKTTEVPDEIPAVMISVGIFYWAFVGISTGNFAPLISSVLMGSIILCAGLLLYKKGQWGGADAWILAAIFYMMPSVGFLAGYVLNFFIVSLVYMLVYSLVLGFRNKGTMKLFADDMKKSWKYVAAITAAFALGIMAFAAILSVSLTMEFASIIMVVFLMAVFWRYAVVVEKNLFKRRIPAKNLKPGDVLESGIWVGVTKDEIKKIRTKKKYVVIKEGVRFVPVFAITLVVTVVYGALLPVIV